MERLVREANCTAPVDLRVGSVLDLPFPDAAFDCVWCANVAAYLTGAEFVRVLGEFHRVTKPSGLVAVKDLDVRLLQFLPLDPAILARLAAARHAKVAETGLLGAWCGPLLGPFFRQAGLNELVRRSWLVERWAPLPPSTRQFTSMLLRFMAGLAAEHDVPPADCEALRAAAADPDRLLDDPDFSCARRSWSHWGGFRPDKGNGGDGIGQAARGLLALLSPVRSRWISHEAGPHARALQAQSGQQSAMQVRQVLK